MGRLQGTPPPWGSEEVRLECRGMENREAGRKSDFSDSVGPVPKSSYLLSVVPSLLPTPHLPRKDLASAGAWPDTGSLAPGFVSIACVLVGPASRKS